MKHLKLNNQIYDIEIYFFSLFRFDERLCVSRGGNPFNHKLLIVFVWISSDEEEGKFIFVSSAQFTRLLNDLGGFSLAVCSTTLTVLIGTDLDLCSRTWMIVLSDPYNESIKEKR